MSTDYLTQKGQAFDRAAFESLLRRKVFLWQSFEPYGSVKVCLSNVMLLSLCSNLPMRRLGKFMASGSNLT